MPTWCKDFQQSSSKKKWLVLCIPSFSLLPLPIWFGEATWLVLANGLWADVRCGRFQCGEGYGRSTLSLLGMANLEVTFAMEMPQGIGASVSCTPEWLCGVEVPSSLMSTSTERIMWIRNESLLGEASVISGPICYHSTVSQDWLESFVPRDR